MKKRSKRYKAMLEVAGEKAEQPVSVEEAVALVKKLAADTKFNQTVELAFRLNIDTKKADQLVRGSFALPNGTGKSVKVVAFAEGAEADGAKAAGAVEVGGEELAEKIKNGWMDFDIAVAHPSMMRFVGKLGKVLGPKGLMPSPKSGTVTPNVAEAVKEFSGGRIEFRNDAHGNVLVIVGTVDFEEKKLVDNIEAMIAHIKSLRPAAVKGHYMTNVVVSSTMGLGFKIAV
ncbi:MAG: 50S ribosomal protein L1 [Planctomycetota bacterium]|jgi:large subunit ribosomal protein L1